MSVILSSVKLSHLRISLLKRSTTLSGQNSGSNLFYMIKHWKKFDRLLLKMVFPFAYFSSKCGMMCSRIIFDVIFSADSVVTFSLTIL